MSNDKYFDLHINGIGYLNRAREVPVRKGPSFYAVDISALHGDADKPEYTRFDAKVSGAEAIEVIKSVMEPISKDKKVLCAFRLGDLYAETFEYRSGKKQGETGISLKTRLLKLFWVKVDGEYVYRAPASDEPASQSDTTPSTDNPEDAVTEGVEDELDALLPTEVSLSKDDPDFEARRAELKKNGYRFDPQDKVWRLPEATAA